MKTVSESPSNQISKNKADWTLVLYPDMKKKLNIGM